MIRLAPNAASEDFLSKPIFFRLCCSCCSIGNCESAQSGTPGQKNAANRSIAVGCAWHLVTLDYRPLRPVHAAERDGTIHRDSVAHQPVAIWHGPAAGGVNAIGHEDGVAGLGGVHGVLGDGGGGGPVGVGGDGVGAAGVHVERGGGSGHGGEKREGEEERVSSHGWEDRFGVFRFKYQFSAGGSPPHEPERNERAASLSPREARVGREPERGAVQPTQLLLSPALSSLLRREEREKPPPSGSGVQSAKFRFGEFSPQSFPPFRMEERANPCCLATLLP